MLVRFQQGTPSFHSPERHQLVILTLHGRCIRTTYEARVMDDYLEELLESTEAQEAAAGDDATEL